MIVTGKMPLLSARNSLRGHRQIFSIYELHPLQILGTEHHQHLSAQCGGARASSQIAIRRLPKKYSPTAKTSPQRPGTLTQESKRSASTLETECQRLREVAACSETGQLRRLGVGRVWTFLSIFMEPNSAVASTGTPAIKGRLRRVEAGEGACAAGEGGGFDAQALEEGEVEVGEGGVVVATEGEVLAVLESAAG